MDNNEFKLRFGNNAVIDKEKYLEYSQIVEQEIFNNINDAKNKAIQIKLEDMNNFVSIFVKSGLNSPKYIIVSLKNREIAHNLFYEEAIDTSTLNILAEHYKTIKQDYNKWKDDVLARINSEEYQTIEEAKEKAKLTIKEDNDLTSVWEKDEKYYVVLSRDREQAFRNDYKEVVKYDDLVEENPNIFEQDENGAFVRLVIPAEFVSAILSPKKTDDMDLRGKKKEELTTDEVIVLKKYAYELSEDKEVSKMNNNVKETKITIRLRNYNGDYGIGSVFISETECIVQQLLNNSNHEDGLIKYSENIGFCANEKLGSNPLATIRTEIPFLVTYDKLNIFNEIIEKIKTNPDYKYNESHYIKERFDPKRLEYVDVIIDGEEFEIHWKDGVYSKIFSEVLDGRNSGIPNMFKEFYKKLSDLMRKTNKTEHDDPSTLNIPYEERIVVKLIDKIKELSPNVETTIAQLLQLTNEDVAKIEPLLQGKVFNNLEKACVEANLKIEVDHDEIGGLGYHYKFKKIN